MTIAYWPPGYFPEGYWPPGYHAVGAATPEPASTTAGGSKLDRVDRALKAQLLDWGLGTPSTIFFLAAEPSDPLPDAGNPQFCLWPGAQRNIAAWERGGGRFNTGADGTLKVKVWSRQEREHAHREDRALNDERGILLIAHGVIDALQEFFPYDVATGVPLTSRALFWQEQSEAVRHAKTPGWLSVTLVFAAQWRLELNVVTMP